VDAGGLARTFSSSVGFPTGPFQIPGRSALFWSHRVGWLRRKSMRGQPGFFDIEGPSLSTPELGALCLCYGRAFADAISGADYEALITGSQLSEGFVTKTQVARNICIVRGAPVCPAVSTRAGDRGTKKSMSKRISPRRYCLRRCCGPGEVLWRLFGGGGHVQQPTKEPKRSPQLLLSTPLSENDYSSTPALPG
jgi:hypothetical protein